MRDHIPGTSARYILALSLKMVYSETEKTDNRTAASAHRVLVGLRSGSKCKYHFEREPGVT